MTRSRARFNVLLTEDRERAVEHWTRQLPRLLEPHGVQAFVARSGREALDLASEQEMHAALIDVLTPPDPARSASQRGPGGLWLLEVLRRMPQRPPAVLVASQQLTPNQVQRLLNQALRLGAFSVVDRPMELENLLAIIRRLLDRRYAGNWPGPDPHSDTNEFENPGLRDSADEKENNQ
ncbi:MAG: response regulator [Phycisphaeraceae bacterium]